MITITITISSLMVQHGGAFFFMMGYEGPQWYPVELICLSVYLSVSLSIYMVIRVTFWRS